jgi:hypothetical protein
MSKLDILTWLAISPLLALRARFEFKRNSSSGEELIAVFRRTAMTSRSTPASCPPADRSCGAPNAAATT